MDIYREEILEHWRNPQNFGKMLGADVIVDQINPLCGDEVTFYFKISRNAHPRGEQRSARAHPGGVIKDVKFTGNGCAISIAASSILSQFIKGKSISYLSKITGEDVLKQIGGSVAPARLKCVFLPLEAIKKLAASKN